MANILWIEDDADRLRGLIRPIIKDGHTVLIAKDKKTATELINSHSDLDLIILDLIIPEGEPNPMHGLDEYVGVELLKQLVAEKARQIPTVVLTVVSDEEVLEKVRALGAIKVLGKGSLLPSELKEEVYKAISSAKK